MGRISTKRQAANPLSHPVGTARTVEEGLLQEAMSPRVAGYRPAAGAMAQAAREPGDQEAELSPAARRHVRPDNTAVRAATAPVVRSVHHRVKRYRAAVIMM